MVNSESVTNISTLQESKNKFRAREARPDKTVAETRGRYHWCGGVGRVEAVAGLRIRDTRTAQRLANCILY